MKFLSVLTSVLSNIICKFVFKYIFQYNSRGIALQISNLSTMLHGKYDFGYFICFKRESLVFKKYIEIPDR